MENDLKNELIQALHDNRFGLDKCISRADVIDAPNEIRMIWPRSYVGAFMIAKAHYRAVAWLVRYMQPGRTLSVRMVA